MPADNSKPLQRIAEVRDRQGVSLRTLARQLGLRIRDVRPLDDPATDLRLSELHRLAKILDVPPAELVADRDEFENQRLRALLMRVARCANTLVERLPAGEGRQVACWLAEMISEELPDMAGCGTLPLVGARRGLDELGRIAERSISISQLASEDLSVYSDCA